MWAKWEHATYNNPLKSLHKLVFLGRVSAAPYLMGDEHRLPFEPLKLRSWKMSLRNP